MVDRTRNAFGRLIVDPDNLQHQEKLAAVSQLVAELLEGHPDMRTCQWLGRKLQNWMIRGGRLEQHLGLAPPPGSHATVRNIATKRRRDDALLRFANTVGNDRIARLVLRGDIPCPPEATDALQALQNFGKVPTSHDAISRARRAARIS